MKVIDLHCDTLMKILESGKSLGELENTHISLGKLKQGHSLAQCFAIFIDREGPVPAAEVLKKVYNIYRNQLAGYSADIRPVLRTSDIAENEKNGLLSSILTLEDAVDLDGNLEKLTEFHKMGIRMIALTHNVENSLGYPNSADPALHALPLKPFGISTIRKMNELGIAVDVSHLSEGGFRDCIRYSGKPVAASHSNAWELAKHPRNLKDWQIRAIADKGGIIGINFYHLFLSNTPAGLSKIDDVLSQIAYISDKGGFDVLGLGSDYDGISGELEWKDYGSQDLLLDAIEKRFGFINTEKICFRNALRFFSDTIG